MYHIWRLTHYGEDGILLFYDTTFSQNSERLGFDYKLHCDLNGSCKYLYMDKPFYDLEKPNRVMLRFLYLVKADRKGTPLQEDISELKDIFGCKIELLPIKQHTTPKEVLDALPIAKNLMSAYSGGYIRGNAEFRLILETSKEQLSRTKKNDRLFFLQRSFSQDQFLV